MTKLLSRGLSLMVLAALLVAPATFAQQAQANFDEEELDSFAEAYVDIEALQIQYQQRFADVEEPAEIEQAQQQFQVEAGEIIEDHGLTLERYQQIIMTTQMDPEFAESLLERVEAVRFERQS